MAITLLRITDGITTLNFSTGDHMELVRYKMVSSSVPEQNAQEEIHVDFIGTREQNLTNFHEINLLLDQARNYKSSKSGPRVYLEIDLGGQGIYSRSELADGYHEEDEKSIGVHWQASFFHVIFHVTRYDSSWLGPRTKLPISNINAEDDLAGLVVTNSSHQIVPISLIGWGDGSVIGWGDGSMLAWGVPPSGAENWFNIQGTDIEGDMPAPIEIQITNNKSGSAKNKEFYLFHNIYSNPLNFNHMINADAFTGDTVTISDDANCQGGKKATLSWTGTAETLIATAPISSTLATNAAGGRFKLIARWLGAFPYSDMFIRFRLLTADNQEISKSDLTLIKSARELSDLDVTRLLPDAQNLPDMEDAKLAIYGFRNHTGTHTLVLNYLQISAISRDGGWKYFFAKDDGIAYGETFVHDDIDRHNYRINTSGKRSSNWASMGGPIVLTPGQDQRLYILQCDKDGAAKIDQEWTVKLFYRPRRSSL